MEKQFIKDLESNGFKKENDPLFPYRKELIDEGEIIETNLQGEDVPCLLFGSTGVNTGFCIYTGENFVWLNTIDVKEAVGISNKIAAFEAV